MIREVIIRRVGNWADKGHKPSGLNLGSKMKTVIHAAVDIAPLPVKTKEKIKGCGLCGATSDALNKI